MVTSYTGTHSITLILELLMVPCFKFGSPLYGTIPILCHLSTNAAIINNSHDTATELNKQIVDRPNMHCKAFDISIIDAIDEMGAMLRQRISGVMIMHSYEIIEINEDNACCNNKRTINFGLSSSVREITRNTSVSSDSLISSSPSVCPSTILEK